MNYKSFIKGGVELIGEFLKGYIYGLLWAAILILLVLTWMEYSR